MKRAFLSFVFLVLACGLGLSQEDTLWLRVDSCLRPLTGKVILEPAQEDYLTEHYHDQKSLYLELLTGDTLIVVSDKWNLFRNQLNRMKRYDIEKYYRKHGYLDWDEELYTRDSYSVSPYCKKVTESGYNVVKYSQKAIHELEYAIFGVPGSEWGPARVGDSVEELFSNLQWASPAIESFSTLVFVHPGYVSGWWSRSPFTYILPTETFKAIRVRLDGERTIESIELGQLSIDASQPFFYSIYDNWDNRSVDTGGYHMSLEEHIGFPMWRLPN